MQPYPNLKRKILELCAEDIFGSWELWWSVREGSQPLDIEDLQRNFVDTMRELTNDGILISYMLNIQGRFVPKALDLERLGEEVRRADTPAPDAFYWFYGVKNSSDEQPPITVRVSSSPMPNCD